MKNRKGIVAREARLRAEITRMKRELDFKREFEEYKRLRKQVHPSKLKRLVAFAIKAERTGVKAKKHAQKSAKEFGL